MITPKKIANRIIQRQNFIRQETTATRVALQRT